MRKSSLLITTIAALILELCLFPLASGADQWAPFTPTNQVGVAITNQFSGPNVSNISGAIAATSSSPWSEQSCSGYAASGDCQFGGPNETATAQLLLPVCDSPSEDNCIASVNIGASSASQEPATFVQATAATPTAAIPSMGLPAGASIGLWQSSVVNAGGTFTYAAYAMVTYVFDDQTMQFRPAFIEAGILPYSQESLSVIASKNQTVQTLPDGQKVYLESTNNYCIWQDSVNCDVQQNFADGTTASMSLRVSKKVTGWLFGRMQNPTVAIAPFDANMNILTVSGQTVDVPAFEATGSYASIPPDFTKFFALEGQKDIFSGLISTLEPQDLFSVAAINDLRSDVNNTATAVQTIWNFQSYNVVDNSCLTGGSQIEGIVTTNSMTYMGNMPGFVNGFFNYQVAGLHYLPDGSLALGSYDMVIADSVARCLYGFSNAPISASITVTDNGSVENIATTTVSDKGGWIHLAADGFTFSNPVIKIKLTQKKALKKISSRVDTYSRLENSLTNIN